MVSLSSKGTTSYRVIGLGRIIKVVLSSIFLKKRLVTFHLIFSSFSPSNFSAKISDSSSEISVSDSCKLCHSASFAQHTPNFCGLYHIWFPSNKIPVQLYLILDLRDKAWLVYRAFKHRSRGGCTFSKATDHY